ncbi:MAG TPA: hypothetical protein VHE55_16740 [Fimbriimonadaceae bacterium]|nr:hypothetical protein [Fimbriimonadaceae bacterium]
MRLKALCWALAVFTFLLLIGWPVFVGLPQRGASKPVLRQYLTRSEIWFTALMVSFLGTTVTAAFVVKQSREEYLEGSADNMRRLIEGTLEDHRKKGESADGN